MEQAFDLYTNKYKFGTKNDKIENFDGEFFTLENILVSVIIKKLGKRRSDLRDVIFRSMKTGVEGGIDAEEGYRSEIKSFKTFKAYIGYANKSTFKNFTAIDNKTRCLFSTTTYCLEKDIPKAEALIDSIVNNLTFKE